MENWLDFILISQSAYLLRPSPKPALRGRIAVGRATVGGIDVTIVAKITFSIHSTGCVHKTTFFNWSKLSVPAAKKEGVPRFLDHPDGTLCTWWSPDVHILHFPAFCTVYCQWIHIDKWRPYVISENHTIGVVATGRAPVGGLGVNGHHPGLGQTVGIPIWSFVVHRMINVKLFGIKHGLASNSIWHYQRPSKHLWLIEITKYL